MALGVFFASGFGLGRRGAILRHVGGLGKHSNNDSKEFSLHGVMSPSLALLCVLDLRQA